MPLTASGGFGKEQMREAQGAAPTLRLEEAPPGQATGSSKTPRPQLHRVGPELQAAQMEAAVAGRVAPQKEMGEGSCFVHTSRL